MQTILITGINGFLGSNLLNRLEGKYTIIGLEYSKKNIPKIKNRNIKIYYSIDYNLEAIFLEQHVDFIIHAATIYRRTEEPINNLIETNILLPIKLYELANSYDVKAFINIDSFFSKVKGEYSYLTEYTLSKRHVLEWLKTLTKNTKLMNVVIYHMYGPFDNSDKFIPFIINKLVNNEDSIDLTSGKQKRDFIYIDDVTSAFEVIIKSVKENSETFVEYEVGTGKSTSIKEFVQLVKKATNSNTKLNFNRLPTRKNEILNSQAKIKQLANIGWKVNYNLLDGLTKLIKTQEFGN